MAITTIQISSSTRDKLSHLKASARETYDEVLNRLLAMIPEGDDEGVYTQAFRIGLLNARLDVRNGRILSHAEAKKQMGL